MSSQLEKYLRNVTAELHSLPEDRREEEIEEIHEHLLSYAEKQKAAGKSDEEAMASALAQFGDPARVGRGIVKTRVQRLIRAPLYAAIIILVMVSISIGVTSQFRSLATNLAVIESLYFTQVLMVGMCVGLALRKAAVKWVALFSTVSAATGLIVDITTTWNYHANLMNGQTSVRVFCEEVVTTIAHALMAIAGAWIGAKISERILNRTKGQAAG